MGFVAWGEGWAWRWPAQIQWGSETMTRGLECPHARVPSKRVQRRVPKGWVACTEPTSSMQRTACTTRGLPRLCLTPPSLPCVRSAHVMEGWPSDALLPEVLEAGGEVVEGCEGGEGPGGEGDDEEGSPEGAAAPAPRKSRGKQTKCSASSGRAPTSRFRGEAPLLHAPRVQAPPPARRLTRAHGRGRMRAWARAAWRLAQLHEAPCPAMLSLLAWQLR